MQTLSCFSLQAGDGEALARRALPWELLKTGRDDLRSFNFLIDSVQLCSLLRLTPASSSHIPLTKHGPCIAQGRIIFRPSLYSCTDNSFRLSFSATVGSSLPLPISTRRSLTSRIYFSVGKTSLMNQYVNKRFSNQYKATIGADLYVDAQVPHYVH